MPPAWRVVEAQVRHYRRTWAANLATTLLTPVLFLVAMGLGLGTLVDRGQGAAGLAGESYLAFLAPGLLAATAMQTAAAECAWPIRLGVHWQKTWVVALATPVRARDLLGGHLAWVALRLLVSAGAFAAVMAAFGVAPLWRGALAVLPAVLTGLAVGAPIAAFVVRLDTDAPVAALFRFGIAPLFLFSGAFFPIAQLPGWLQPVAAATPLWHGVELCRAAALGLQPAWPALAHAGYLLVWAATGALAAVRAFERRLVR